MTSATSSRSASSMAPASRSSIGSASHGGCARAATTPTRRRWASFSSAIRMNTPATPIARCSIRATIREKFCRWRKTRPASATLGGMAPTWYCATLRRTSSASGNSSTLRRSKTRTSASVSPLPWSDACWRTMHQWRVARSSRCATKPSRASPIRSTRSAAWRICGATKFTFDHDPDATACPFGAHIRRANPRNADLPAGTRGPIAKLLRTLGFDSEGPHHDLLASTRFHRILRRGREYGPRLAPADAIVGKERDQKRGLRFICLNANISRQFEFVQAAWIANPKFSGTDEGDPLLGNRKPLATGRPTNGFTQPQDGGLPCRTAGLSLFVTVRGGAYFFLPGIAALRYLATATKISVS